MSKEKKIRDAQHHLKEIGADGWLLYDFHRNNELAHLFLELSSANLVTRRFFYWIPKKGTPVKIVHAIEAHCLDAWPGIQKTYFSWQSLHRELKELLKGVRKVAMEYSPQNKIPYISKVDAGTADLIRSFGVEMVSSGPFLPYFTAVLDEQQGESHLRAAKALDQIAEETWQWIADHLKQKKTLTEYDVQQKILESFASKRLVAEDPPIVAVNAHSADPHYEPRKENSSPIREGDWILIDLWAKEKEERAIFGDITRVAVALERPRERQEKIFQIVRAAQKAATSLIQQRFAQKQRLEGWEVDDAARRTIEQGGFGPYFLHRTGHSITTHLHGSGACMDNFETRDERPLLPGTCFSIEPAVYLAGEFGVRLEYDIYIDLSGAVHITGGIQERISCLY